MVDDEVGVRVMNLDLKTTSILSMPAKSRPHGIAYYEDNDVLAVNFSGRDAVGLFHVASGELIREIKISDKYEKMGVPQHHINDCCVYGGYLYVSMFSFSGNWKIGMYDGGIMQYDIETGQCLGPVVSNLWMPHTPIVIDGVLRYCDSMRGIVSDSTWKVLIKLSGFVRGITYDGQYYYVGQSAHRYIDRLEGTMNNIALDTGIYLVDPVCKASRFYSIPDVTDINSVIVLSR